MAEGLDALFADADQVPEPKEPVKEPAKEPAQAGPEPVAEPVKVDATPPPAPPVKHDGTLAALLDEREKRQRAERERDALRSKQQPEQIPSIRDDPDGYAAHLDKRFAEAERNQRFGFSERWAVKEFGADTVTAAKEWALGKMQEEVAQFGFSPFRDAHLAQEHPIDWVVKQHKHDGLINNIGADPDAWVRKRYAELTETDPALAVSPPASSPQPAPQPKPAPPSRSLASAPSSGGGTHAVPSGPGTSFDAAFQK